MKLNSQTTQLLGDIHITINLLYPTYHKLSDLCIGLGYSRIQLATMSSSAMEEFILSVDSYLRTNDIHNKARDLAQVSQRNSETLDNIHPDSRKAKDQSSRRAQRLGQARHEYSSDGIEGKLSGSTRQMTILKQDLQDHIQNTLAPLVSHSKGD